MNSKKIALMIGASALFIFGFYMFWFAVDPGYYGASLSAQLIRSYDIIMYLVLGGISSGVGIILVWKTLTTKRATVIPKYE